MRYALLTVTVVLSAALSCSSQQSPPASESAVSSQILAELATQLGVSASDLDPDVVFSDLNPQPDQLDVVELIMTIEERFQIEVTDESIAKYTGSADLDDIAANLSVRSLSKIVLETQR